MSDMILAWIQFAIQVEQGGLDFYKKCLEKVEDPRAKEMFKFLIGQEEEHKKRLTELLNETAGNDQQKINMSVERYNMMSKEPPIFTDEQFKEFSDPNTMVMEMFNKAMNMEKNGINIYLDLEKNSVDPELKKLFHDLAGQEVIHKKQIQDVAMSLLGMEPDEEGELTPEKIEKELAGSEEIIKEFKMTAKDGKFEPNVIKANKGETILIKLTSVGEPAGFKSVNFSVDEYIPADKETEIKFIANIAGEYNFFSNVPSSHGNQDMRGTILVEGENVDDDEL